VVGVGGHRATPKESTVHHPESRSRRKGEYGLPVTQRKRITAYGLHTSRDSEGVEYAYPRTEFGVGRKKNHRLIGGFILIVLVD